VIGLLLLFNTIKTANQLDPDRVGRRISLAFYNIIGANAKTVCSYGNNVSAAVARLLGEFDLKAERIHDLSDYSLESIRWQGVYISGVFRKISEDFVIAQLNYSDEFGIGFVERVNFNDILKLSKADGMAKLS